MESFVKRFMHVVVFSAVVCFMFAAGCSNTAKKSEEAKPEASAAPVQAVVTFDGGNITVDEIKTILSKMTPRERQNFQTPDGVKNLVKQLADNAILAQAAQEEGLTDTEEVKTILKIIRNVRLSQEYFESKIKPMADSLVIPEEELLSYYNANAAKYDKSEVKARHILIRESEEKAKEVYEQVKKNPAKFSELAMKLSEDKGSGAKGGDLGFFGHGRMVPEFEAVAFSLPVGEISEPIKSQFGWHIIIVDEKKEVPPQSFEEARASIENELKRGKSQGVVDAAIEEVKARLNLKIDDNLIPLITEAAAAPAAPQVPAANVGTPPPPPAPPATEE